MFRLIFLLKLELFRMLKITRRVIFKIRKSSVTAVLLLSRTVETRKLKLFYFQKEARHRAKKLWTGIFLGNLSLNEGKNFVGLPVFNSRIWWRHVKTKNYARNNLCYPASWFFPSPSKLLLVQNGGRPKDFWDREITIIVRFPEDISFSMYECCERNFFISRILKNHGSFYHADHR